jgi:hypothetical protein
MPEYDLFRQLGNVTVPYALGLDSGNFAGGAAKQVSN